MMGKSRALSFGAELNEQIENLIDNIVGPAVFAVNFIYYDYGF